MKCPYCERDINRLVFKPLDGSALGGPIYACIAIGCPNCNKVLSAQIDPVRIQTDTVDEVKELLDNRRTQIGN
jgi:phage FluMu protein Com